MLPLTETALLAWALAFARLSGWALFDPMMRRLPAGIRLMFAAALAAALVPGLPSPAMGSLGVSVLPMLALEILWGAALALAVGLVFALAQGVVLWTGHTATAGVLLLSPAQAETSDAPWRSLAGWLAILAFLGAGGHLLVVAALRESFAAMPLATWPAVDGLRSFGESLSGLFAAGAALALPLLALVLLAQLAFQVLARTTPGLDLFSMGLGLAALTLLTLWALAAPAIARGVADGLTQLGLWAGLWSAAR